MRASGWALLLTSAVGCSHPSSPGLVERTLLDRVVPSAQGAVAHAGPAPVSRTSGPIQLAEITLESVVPSRGAEPSASDSVGLPNRGRLRNAKQLSDGPFWTVVNPKRAWGTAATITQLEASVRQVATRMPGPQRLFIGDLSRQDGGYIRPHRSHQSGRDADIGYYYLGKQKWYAKANAENLDRARTWGLLKALMSEGDVEFVFMDRSIQALLRSHAEEIGEDSEFLDSVFQRSSKDETLVRHTYGHLTHFHVRFYAK